MEPPTINRTLISVNQGNQGNSCLYSCLYMMRTVLFYAVHSVVINVLRKGRWLLWNVNRSHGCRIEWYNFRWPWVTPNPGCKVTVYLEVEYVKKGAFQGQRESV